MKKNGRTNGKSFVNLFLFYFIIITFFSVIIFIFAGLRMLDSFFSYYEDMLHAETREMLLAKVKTHYMMYNSWDGYNGYETGESAKILGNFFTVRDMNGNTLYTSEDSNAICCGDSSHFYVNAEVPITVEGRIVGTLTTGFFKNHISSPDEALFKKSGAIMIISSVVAISFIGAFISILFFYMLSKPLKKIAFTAKNIAAGKLEDQIYANTKISEINEIASSLNFLSESLIGQEKFRRELTSELSHELRTPLQILLNHAEAIIDGIYPADQANIEAMHSEIKRINKLLDELEDRLIYNSEHFDIVPEIIDISDITSTIALGYGGSFLRQGLAFNIDIDKKIIAKADSSRYAQAVVNILSNALKYTAEGSVSLSLKEEKNSAAVLTITDTGEGIEETALDHIFKRFYHSGKNGESRGVGLYIVKLVCDKHGWLLDISSTKNKGTTIKICIK